MEKFKFVSIFGIVIFFTLSIIFCSCSHTYDGYFKKEEIVTQFVVTDIYTAKYSKVTGYIIHNNLKVFVDNGNNGYYYKDYNLSIGDKFQTNIIIYYYSTNYGYELVFGDLDLSKYEINN